jgi:hypothetical protein
MSSRIVKFMKGNTIAMIALFIALGGTASAATLAVNSVGSKQLKKNAVTAAKIKAGAVTTLKIKDGSVATAKIADGSVTTAKLADGSIATAKIADGSIATAKIANDAVTGTQVLESSLGKVPAAANADTLGGVSKSVLGTTIKVIGMGFNPRYSTTAFGSGAGGFGIYSSDGVSADFITPVQVPQGATVTKLTMFYNNTATASSGTLWFVRYRLDGNTTDQASVVAPATPAGYGSVSTTFTTVIDNTTYAYGFVWRSAANTNTLAGAQIDYTLPGATAAATAGNPAPSGPAAHLSGTP